MGDRAKNISYLYVSASTNKQKVCRTDRFFISLREDLRCPSAIILCLKVISKCGRPSLVGMAREKSIPSQATLGDQELYRLLRVRVSCRNKDGMMDDDRGGLRRVLLGAYLLALFGWLHM